LEKNKPFIYPESTEVDGQKVLFRVRARNGIDMIGGAIINDISCIGIVLMYA
jgi:hypothetical protein